MLRSELDFVLDASERVGSVLFVMNRVDLNPDWDDMRREHRDRIWRAAQDHRAKQTTSRTAPTPHVRPNGSMPSAMRRSCP